MQNLMKPNIQWVKYINISLFCFCCLSYPTWNISSSISNQGSKIINYRGNTTTTTTTTTTAAAAAAAAAATTTTTTTNTTILFH